MENHYDPAEVQEINQMLEYLTQAEDIFEKFQGKYDFYDYFYDDPEFCEEVGIKFDQVDPIRIEISNSLSTLTNEIDNLKANLKLHLEKYNNENL
jgi:hypothetical protein